MARRTAQTQLNALVAKAQDDAKAEMKAQQVAQSEILDQKKPGGLRISLKYPEGFSGGVNVVIDYADPDIKDASLTYQTPPPVASQVGLTPGLASVRIELVQNENSIGHADEAVEIKPGQISSLDVKFNKQ